MPRILVVTDTPWSHDQVRAALTDTGIELVHHEDPTTVTEAIAKGRYDAVLADLQIGSMGGMAVTRSVREAAALGDLPQIPVVLMLDRSADAFLAKRAGAAAWVAKPFTSHTMTATLNHALTNTKANFR